MPSRLLLAVLGVALVVGSLTLATRARPVDVGDLELAAPAPSASDGPPNHRAPSDTRSPDPTPPVLQARPARLADLAPPTRIRPVRVVADGVDVDVPVAAVGIRPDGQMAIPEDVGEAGWYRHGVAPGEAGNAVIAGHVDDRTQGLGAFHRLEDLAVGDRVHVAMVDGSQQPWQVTARREVDKFALALDELFSRTGRPQLVLVTCGGEFDERSGSYRSNVVVVARPVQSTGQGSSTTHDRGL